MSKRKSVDLRTFVTNAIAAIPSRKRNNLDSRYSVVLAVREAAQRGQIRKLDGTRYATATVNNKAFTLYNEIVGL